jgi:hypothetical protein
MRTDLGGQTQPVDIGHSVLSTVTSGFLALFIIVVIVLGSIIMWLAVFRVMREWSGRQPQSQTTAVAFSVVGALYYILPAVGAVAFITGLVSGNTGIVKVAVAAFGISLVLSLAIGGTKITEHFKRRIGR